MDGEKTAKENETFGSFKDGNISLPHPAIDRADDSDVLISQTKVMSSQRQRISARQYASLFVLFFCNLINLMDRFTVSGLLSKVQAYFGINDSMAGLLQTVFIVFFMTCAPVSGFFGDRHSRKRIMMIGMSIWICAVFASSFVPPHMFWLFLLLRGTVGIGEASFVIVAPSVIGDMFPLESRSRFLMFFYAAIPIGSGCGYIFGSSMARLLGSWNWGVRLTPIFGITCILLIAFVLKEPKRGQAEKAAGGTTAVDVKQTSYREDLVALCRIPTYLCATFGFTCTMFTVGTLSWWSPTVIELAVKTRMRAEGITDTAELHSVPAIFGVLILASGLLGIALGSSLAQAWTTGRWCCRLFKTSRAKALVCAIGSLTAVPFLLLQFHFLHGPLLFPWIFFFIGVLCLSLNWAIVIELLFDVVVPQRRNVATAWQVLIAHLFGDASGPYIIGIVSDWLRKDDTIESHFASLLFSLNITIIVLLFSSLFFFVAAWLYVSDRRAFLEQIGCAADELNASSSSDARSTQLNGETEITTKA